MKTTIEISDDLLRRARQLADERGLTLRALVEEGLRLSLQARSEPAQPTFRLRTWGRGGLTDEARDRGLHATLLELHEQAQPPLVTGGEPRPGG
jgi:predicted transcriptional regulator